MNIEQERADFEVWYQNKCEQYGVEGIHWIAKLDQKDRDTMFIGWLARAGLATELDRRTDEAKEKWK